MKTLSEIEKTLNAWHQKYGLPIAGLTQRSEDWLNIKLGIPSASCASDIVAKKDTKARSNYMAELVAQVCTAIPNEDLNFKEVKWGRDHEPAARKLYAYLTGRLLTQPGFVFKDDKYRLGCSPDDVFAEKDAPKIITGGVEYKCPFNSANFIKFKTAEEMNRDWEWQQQMTIWIMGAEGWDHCQYDPRMLSIPKLHRLPIAKNPDMQKKLEDTVPEFLKDFDAILKSLGVTFGDHWKQIHEIQQAQKKASA